MEFPLAHDENGTPLDVPATAIGWLVRRHAGGRGRPATVYDGEGRPLVVSLDATTTDLRAEGCRAGTYRLDAVDSSRRLLGVTAYTEVLFDGLADQGADVGASGLSSDAAVAALARAVEAMQRVQAERERAQAERERVQAEMLARLVDRLAPPAPPPPKSLSETIREYEQASKLIRNLALDSADGGPGDDASNPMMAMISQALEVAKVIAAQKLGAAAPPATPDQPSIRNASGCAAGEDEPSPGERRPEPEAASAEGFGGHGEAADGEPQGIQGKLDAVLEQLSREEVERVLQLSESMPRPLIDQALQHLVTMTPEQGAAAVRQLLQQYAGTAGRMKVPS